jgi:hypothetical protein
MDKGTTNDLAASRSSVPSPDEMRGAALICRRDVHLTASPGGVRHLGHKGESQKRLSLGGAGKLRPLNPRRDREEWGIGLEGQQQDSIMSSVCRAASESASDLSMAAWNTDTRISEGAQYQAWEPGSVPDTVAVTLMVGLRPSAEGPQSRGWPQCAKSRPMLTDSTPHRGDFKGEK